MPSQQISEGDKSTLPPRAEVQQCANCHRRPKGHSGACTELQVGRLWARDPKGGLQCSGPFDPNRAPSLKEGAGRVEMNFSAGAAPASRDSGNRQEPCSLTRRTVSPEHLGWVPRAQLANQMKTSATCAPHFRRSSDGFHKGNEKFSLELLCTHALRSQETSSLGV